MKCNFTHKVRNCKEWDASKFTKHGCISYKEDGVRAFFYPGEPLLWSRQEKPIYGMDHIVQELEDQDTGWPIDMELTVEGMKFNESSGIIRNHEASPQVKAGVIDVVCPGDILHRFRMRPVPMEHVHLISHWRVNSLAQVVRKYNEALSYGMEGVVWKSINHEYANKRNFDWMRLVPIKSEDCEVLDIYEGKGKMAGILGGFVIQFGKHVCKVGTLKDFTYEDRAEVWETAGIDYIGQRIQVDFKELQPSGKPRQPRFKKGNIRWDK
jgi:hypothetical protein